MPSVGVGCRVTGRDALQGEVVQERLQKELLQPPAISLQLVATGIQIDLQTRRLGFIRWQLA